MCWIAGGHKDHRQDPARCSEPGEDLQGSGNHEAAGPSSHHQALPGTAWSHVHFVWICDNPPTMKTGFICHLYLQVSHETIVDSSSFVRVLCRVSLVLLRKIFGSLWAWMLKVSTAACAVTQHKHSISSSPIMTYNRGSAHIVICLSVCLVLYR